MSACVLALVRFCEPDLTYLGLMSLVCESWPRLPVPTWGNTITGPVL